MVGCVNNLSSCSLRQECEDACAAGAFHRAGVCGGKDLEVRDAIRTDQVLWLDTVAPSLHQSHYLDMQEILRTALNGRFFWGYSASTGTWPSTR